MKTIQQLVDEIRQRAAEEKESITRKTAQVWFDSVGREMYDACKATIEGTKVTFDFHPYMTARSLNLVLELSPDGKVWRLYEHDRHILTQRLYDDEDVRIGEYPLREAILAYIASTLTEIRTAIPVDASQDRYGIPVKS